MKLRPYQRKAIDAIYQYFEYESGNPIISAPTGAGKSVIIAAFCQEVLHDYPTQRILMLTHVKELVRQNHEKLMTYFPGAPAGIYSASLKLRQPHHPIVFATIQSVHKKAEILGKRDIVIVDECHLISPTGMGMYRRLLDNLLEINPQLKVVGMSATPFRTGTGMLHEAEGSIFTDIAYDIPIWMLIEDGYLSKLVSKSSEIQANLLGVGVSKGDYKTGEMEARFKTITTQLVDDAVKLAEGRKSIIIFCVSIEHSEEVARLMNAKGIETKAISSNTPHDQRDKMLSDFKARMLHCLTSVMVVSTGFDAPCIDCIILARATKSPGLYLQMVGRGLRIMEGKENCLILDYGSNIIRHGPVTQVKPPSTQRGAGKGDSFKAMVKICKVCRTANDLDAMECETCGTSLVEERDMTKDLEEKAADVDIMGEKPVEEPPQWLDVAEVNYFRHKKEGKPDSLKVSYYAKYQTFNEWVCQEHSGFAKRKADAWVAKRNKYDFDFKSIEITLLNTHLLTPPTRIQVKKNGKYWEITDYDFTERKDTDDREPEDSHIDFGENPF